MTLGIFNFFFFFYIRLLLIAEVNEVFGFTQYFRPYNWSEDKRDQCTFIVHHCQQAPWKGQEYLYRCIASTPY